MNSSVWQLDRYGARLQLGVFTGRIDLARPDEGLVDLAFAISSFADVHLLAVRFSSLPPDDPETPDECYVRKSDLMAVYDPSDRRPIHVETRWRVTTPLALSGTLAGIELMVSVRTELLDSRSELSVHSALPAAEVLRLADPRSGRFEMLDAERPHLLDPNGGSGCLVFRFSNSDLSYAEMVHPADFREDRLRGEGESARITRLSHRLFPSPLEKGVILVARVQGILLRRSNDTRAAAEHYSAFAEAEPPLAL